ncbi:MAG: MerR family transcriptional regulator [Propioniciclava sp.]|uniref:transcriptional regulator FtsR n=1 Tax=Propioniciclava sp. TaxID=2038686 RepID=UPI0039E33E96
MPAATKSIGGVLKILKEDFPDITISKIRFLEGEGLISPERAPSGYRRYSERDITRLRYILDVQKNQYLPLKVIRENLEARDRGEEPAAPAPRAEAPVALDVVPPAPAASRSAGKKRPIHVTRKELLAMSGLTEAKLTELEQHELVVPRRGTAFYGRDALTVAVAARRLAAYGWDVRHLRALKQVAEREAAMIEQAVGARSRRRTASRADTAEVMRLVMYAHAALLRSATMN